MYYKISKKKRIKKYNIVEFKNILIQLVTHNEKDTNEVKK